MKAVTLALWDGGDLHCAAYDPTNEKAEYKGEYYVLPGGEGAPEPTSREQSRGVGYVWALSKEDALALAEKEIERV